MYYVSSSKYLSEWHVSKDKQKAKLSASIIRKFDYESEVKSGVLFGFPEESAKAYAYNRNLEKGKDQISVVYPGWIYFHPYLKDKYYAPYIFYAIRKDRVKEDSRVAKKWADTIRKDVPTLARWYEKLEKKRRLQELRRK